MWYLTTEEIVKYNLFLQNLLHEDSPGPLTTSVLKQFLPLCYEHLSNVPT